MSNLKRFRVTLKAFPGLRHAFQAHPELLISPVRTARATAAGLTEIYHSSESNSSS